jgi:hypothetical protein
MKHGEHKELYMTFKLFEKTRSGASNVPSLTVTKGEFFFNKAAQVAFDIADYSYAEFVYDEAKHQIGIKVLEERTLHANKLSGKKDHSTISMAAKAIINHLGVVPGLYPLTQDDDTGFLTFTYRPADKSAAAEEEHEDEAEAEEGEAAIHTRRRGRPRKAA